MTPNDPDNDLVRAARQGDRQAFAILVERHRPVLLALCTRLLRDHNLAEDVAQEAVLRAYLSLDHLRQIDRFGAWLVGIGLNLARHSLKDRGQNPWSLDALVGGRHVDEPIDWQIDPVALAEEAEIAAQVRQVVDGLPRGQRAAVLLFYLSELTYAETAVALGIEIGVVKQRLHKARATLRQRLAKIGEGKSMLSAKDDQLVAMRIADVRRIGIEGGHLHQHIVVLEEVDGPRRLQIWVGGFEGEALALALERTQLPRPYTFAFTASLLQAVGGKLRAVVVSELVDDVFYAQAVVGMGRSGKERVVDARPSDALNLALILDAPIRVSPLVLEQATKPPENTPLPHPSLYGEGTSGAKEIVAEIIQGQRSRVTPPH